MVFIKSSMRSEIEFVTSQTCQSCFLKIFYNTGFLCTEIQEVDSQREYHKLSSLVFSSRYLS